MEATIIKADTTVGTTGRIDHSLIKSMIVSDLFVGKRGHYQMEVRGIDITVCICLGLGKPDEGTGDGSLAGTSLAA
jgi:hypothetical protein